jgi:hypothetical protein
MEILEVIETNYRSIADQEEYLQIFFFERKGSNISVLIPIKCLNLPNMTKSKFQKWHAISPLILQSFSDKVEECYYLLQIKIQLSKNVKETRSKAQFSSVYQH